MNYIKITQFDTANGLGVGTVLWVAGCEHHCPQCHNPQTHDPSAGREFTNTTLEFLLNTLEPEYITRLTLSGGDPLYKDNRFMSEIIMKVVRDRFPDKKIWLYTGYTFEEIIDNHLQHIFSLADVLVDGRFEIAKKDLNLLYRGSSNQRVIDVKKTIEVGSIVLYDFDSH